MKPNFLTIRGTLFTDITLGNRTIELIGAHETFAEAETWIGDVVQDAETPRTYYIIQFKQEVEVFMKPTVKIEKSLQDIIMAEEG